MRKFITVLAACTLLTSCAHAQEHQAQEHQGTAPAAKSSHAAENAEYRVYDADANSMADVDAVLMRAGERGTKALIVIGANWCHDSRGMAARLDRPEFKTLITENYELVYVSAGTNPGQKNQNRDVSQRFGVDQIEGTPTVFIANPDGSVLNADSAGYWRRADSIPVDMSYAYLDMYAKK